MSSTLGHLVLLRRAILLTYTGPPGSGSRDGARPSTVVFWLTPLLVVCPRIVYTDLNGFICKTLQFASTALAPVPTGAHTSLTLVGSETGSRLLLPFGTTDLVEIHILPTPFGLLILSITQSTHRNYLAP
jgi:hypothetical protein